MKRPGRLRAVSPKRPHWYKLFLGECPVCGSDKSYRERVYGRKPRDPRKRIEYLSQKTTYDGCLQ